jgi:hypothetical protein
MKAIHDIVPDPEVLLSMKPDEVAGVILEHFNSNPTMQIGKYNFGLRYTVQEYPAAYQDRILRALMTGWNYLEREGFIAEKPASESFTGGWYFVTDTGREIKEAKDMEKYRKASSQSQPPAQVTIEHRLSVPVEIQDSLQRFRRDYPNSEEVAFLMMKFGSTIAHKNIVGGVRGTLSPVGITIVRADDKEYHPDLFYNILTYIYGCRFGIAVFERIEHEEFNPNVSLEVGYMLALGKPVCLLKDQTLKTLHTDLVGRLYRIFDPLDPISTIPSVLTKWLKDQGIIESRV